MTFKIVYQVSFIDDLAKPVEGGVINHKITRNQLEVVKKCICDYIDKNFKENQDGPLLEQAELAVNVPVREYDDHTLMPFGKHKNKKLCEVPASYLHWLWTQKPLADKQLEAYIKQNIHVLKQEHPDGIWT